MNSDLFDPRTVVMDDPKDECEHDDFRFAFNNSNFSDRVLRIYIFTEPIESTQSSSVARVKTLHISSPILASRSPFFYKLFSNGMKESEQYHAILRINALEEVALMELLKFMYSNVLTVTTSLAVLDVLMVADKFDVASCVRHCSRLLRNLPMTPESVLVYLDLPSTVLTAEAFQPLTVAAKQFYAVHYKDITKFQDEILSLSLASVEAIISSDDLRVESEDAVFCFVIKWAQAQYTETKDRREIIRTRLAKFIRYPYMTPRKLKEVFTCKEFDPCFVLTIVKEAVSFKVEVPHKPHTYINDENSYLYHSIIERAYTYKPIKIIRLKEPGIGYVVYLDLKRDVCTSLFPSGTVSSEEFVEAFYLFAQCNTDQEISFHSFGLYLGMREKEMVSLAFDYEFAARSKPTDEFASKLKGSCKFTGGTVIGSQNLFAIPWTSFIDEDSVYFIDDVLHLRVELTNMRLTN